MSCVTRNDLFEELFKNTFSAEVFTCVFGGTQCLGTSCHFTRKRSHKSQKCNDLLKEYVIKLSKQLGVLPCCYLIRLLKIVIYFISHANVFLGKQRQSSSQPLRLYRLSFLSRPLFLC